jgi:hypothetical protein
MKILRAFLPVALFLLVVTSVRSAKADLVIFGSGFSLPENISLAPMDFGSFGGDYFIPDPGVNQLDLGNIDYLPPAGGTATVFVTLPGGTERPLGGLFLPNDFGSLGGQYLAVGGDANGAFAMAVDANHNVIPVLSRPGGQFVNPVLAPSGFGSVAGQVLVTSSDGTVSAINQMGQLSPFASVPGASLFGSVFAPQGFGSVGGDMLVTDAASGNIFAVDANGNARLFTTIPLGPNQPGLRQMAFAPVGFGPYGGDLFLSISGSGAGGGTLGSLVVVDPNGNEIAALIIGSDINAFDPRGLFFVDDQTLLISSSDPIFLGTPQDFQPVPEPGTVLFFTSGIVGWWLKGRRLFII